MRPNIVLVVLDTVRAQSLSLYGHERPTTPFLERLAASSTVFERAYAPSCWTVPSHATLFTGLEPAQHRVGGEQASLDAVGTPTLAERLGEAGYATVGVSANPWVGPAFGFDRGFKRFHSGWKFMQSGVDVASQSITQGGQPVGEKLRMAVRGGPVTALATAPNYALARWRRSGRFTPFRMVRRLLQMHTEESRDHPVFGFLNLLDAHLPYIAPRSTRAAIGVPGGWQKVPQRAWPYVGGIQPMSDQDFEVLRRLYDAEIRYLDRALEKLVEQLDRSARPTLLVITSDHGENIGEHGLMDHQFSLHDTLIRVPLLVRNPGGAEAGLRRDDLVGLADVHGTILAGAGLEHSAALPGPSGGARRPHVTSDYLRPQPPVSRLRSNFPDGEFTRCDRSLRALMRDDGRKLIWSSDGSHEEYDLRSDPGEQRSLYDASASAALLAELDAAFGGAAAPAPATPVAATSEDDEVRAALESLGYL